MKVTYAACIHTPQCEYSKRGECLARQAKDRKRVKHVVSSGQVPHLWFHKAQDSAKNGTGSLYFQGDTIYSYGSHFPIARHVQSGKKSAVLFTERNHSVTTSGHKSSVRSAIPEGTTVFHVEDVFTYGTASREYHAVNLKSYINRVEMHVTSCARARSSWKKESEHGYAASLRNEAREYAKFFKLPLPKIAPIPALDSDGLARIKASESKKSAEKAAKEKTRRIETAKQELEALNEWRAGATGYRNFYSSPIALRLTKDKTELETSRGARIPVEHAIRVLAIVRRVVERGEAFQTNGHTIHVGVYKIDRIEVNGDLKAGCHSISYQEIQRLAPELEAIASEVQS
jgi:hypothetical protein